MRGTRWGVCSADQGGRRKGCLEKARVGRVKVLGVRAVGTSVRGSLSLLLLSLLGLLRLLAVRRRGTVLRVAGASGRTSGSHGRRSALTRLLTLLLLRLLDLLLASLLLRGGGARSAVAVRVALEGREVGRDLLRELVESVVRAVRVVRGGVRVVEVLLVRHLLLRLSRLRLLRTLLADLGGRSRVLGAGRHRRRGLVARSRSRELAVSVVEALRKGKQEYTSIRVRHLCECTAPTYHRAHRVLAVEARVVGRLRAKRLAGRLLLRDRVERGVRALSRLLGLLVARRRRVRVSTRVLEVRRRDTLSLVGGLVELAVRRLVVLLLLTLLLLGRGLLRLLLRLLAVRRRHARVALERRSGRSRLLALEELVRRLRERVLGRLVVLLRLLLLKALVRRVLLLLVLLLRLERLLLLVLLVELLLLDRRAHLRQTRGRVLVDRELLLLVRLLLLLLGLLALLLLLGLLLRLSLLLLRLLLLRLGRSERRL